MYMIATEWRLTTCSASGQALDQLVQLRLHVADELSGVTPHFLEALGLRRQPPVMVVLEGMETLGWGYKELVKYLVARDKLGELHDSDWSHLQRSRVTSNGDGSEAYMPTTELRQLELPVIAWKGSAPSSAEYNLLSKLGVLERPTLEALLAKASGDGTTKAVQAHALAFLCPHVSEYPYDPTANFLIVPTTVAGVFARPCECYTERSPWPDHFLTVHPTQLSASARTALCLPHRPPLPLALQQVSSRSEPMAPGPSCVSPLHLQTTAPLHLQTYEPHAS